ncbi:hypothetical protein D1872_302470 [compost metagenome]
MHLLEQVPGYESEPRVQAPGDAFYFKVIDCKLSAELSISIILRRTSAKSVYVV